VVRQICNGGTCGIFATQLYPPGELEYAFLTKVFQKEVVSHFAGAGAEA
jgi:hypothetical protein